MNVLIKNSAESDIKAIYLMLKEYDTIPAVNFRNSFRKFRTNIRNFPYMYPIYALNSDYRAGVIMYDYIVFYKVNEAEKAVNIYRVLHGSRNMAAILKNT